MASALEILNAANMQFLRNVPAFVAPQTTGQSIANAAVVTLIWQAPTTDTYSGWSAGSPTKYTPKVAGYYDVFGAISFTANATGNRDIVVQKNSATVTQTNGLAATAADVSVVQVTAPLVFFNGSTDFVEIAVLQRSGGALLTTGTSSLFTAKWVHA